MQYITVYTPNSVHLNQITPSTATTVSLVAFHQSLLLLLIPWRLSGGPCANLRASPSPTRHLSSYRSQARHPKMTLTASLSMLLLGQACLNKIRSRWLLSQKREPRTLHRSRSCRNALIILISTTARPFDVSSPNSALSSFAVYYRVYSSEGDEKAKTSFDEGDISLGRINTLFIAPPHTAGSLKAHIAKVEGLVTPGHALYKNMELFQDMDSDAAMSDTDVISFQGDTYPGSDEGYPVALVNATANTAADQKPKPTSGKVLNEYPLDTAATNHVLSDGPDSTFTKRVRLYWTWGE